MAQRTLDEVVAEQFQAANNAGQQVTGLVTQIVNLWIENFKQVEAVKNKRTEQLQKVLSFVQALAKGGLPPLVEMGNSIHDPELSNQVMEANNQLMTASQNLINQIMAEEQAAQQPPQPKQEETPVEVEEVSLEDEVAEEAEVAE